MSILKEPTLDEIKRYNKNELGVTLLDGEIVRILAICEANKKAKAQGKNEEKRLITEKSLKIGISIDKIIGATGLSKSEF